MSRIIGMTLLLVVLLDNLCDSTASSDQVRVNKLDIRLCRCKVITGGKIKCPYPLVPTNYREKQDLNKCLCKKAKEQNRPELLQFCRVLGSATPL